MTRQVIKVIEDAYGNVKQVSVQFGGHEFIYSTVSSAVFHTNLSIVSAKSPDGRTREVSADEYISEAGEPPRQAFTGE